MKLRARFSWIGASLLAAFLLAPEAGAEAHAGAVAAAAAGEGGIRLHEVHEVLLSVIINGENASEPVLLLRQGNQFYATAGQLSSWRIKHEMTPALVHRGEHYFRITTIADLNVNLDEASQTLSISSRPDMLQPTQLSYGRAETEDEVVGGTGGFLNYDVSAELADDHTMFGGALQAGIYSKWGVGISSFVGRRTADGSELILLDTNWTVDDPAGMRSLRLGDSITRAGVGGKPLRFTGIQLARNFAVQPGFVTIPLPSIDGTAAVPSVVDIYVNDALRDTRSVRPGPFEITDVPIVTGNGQVQLIVRDLLGREQRFTQSYYASSNLLRAGLQDYSYEVGFLRRSFGQKSHDYGPLMLSATHRYGVSNSFTAEAHVEASSNVQVAGLAGGLALGGFGNLETSVAASRGQNGGGLSAGLRFERRTRGLSFGLHTEVNSDRYTSLDWSLERRAPRMIFEAFAGVPVSFGSVGFSYVRRDGRTERDVEYASANASLRLGSVGSLHIAGRKSLMRAEGLSADLMMVLPFRHATSSSAGASVLNNKVSYRTTLHKSVPVGEGVGYELTATSGDFNGVSGRVSAHTSFGAHEAQLSWTGGRTGLRVTTAGGIGRAGGEVFASRKLDQSFALVKVGDYSNVRVYADNHLVGRTNRRGTLVVPTLRAYDRNKLRLEIADLPLDAEVGAEERTVRPYDRHGVLVDFHVNPLRAALVRVLLADGSRLPAGSVVKLYGQDAEFVSAPGGEVYVTGLADNNNVVVASWTGGSCRFNLPFGQSKLSLEALQEFVCLPEAQ